jgi:hypothetical protein
MAQFRSCVMRCVQDKDIDFLVRKIPAKGGQDIFNRGQRGDVCGHALQGWSIWVWGVGVRAGHNVKGGDCVGEDVEVVGAFGGGVCSEN